jgi:TolB-like protein/tetratricopeptide (TPR) repeat protein
LSAVFKAEGFEVRPAERRLLAHGQPVPLGARAFDLLMALIEQRDRVVTKDELLARVWPGVVVEENNLTVQISSLRKVLGNGAIATVAGRGYRFTLPLLDEAAARAAPAAAPLPHERPVIAVLAFDNLSNDPEMQFFSDGVSEEIIQRLARGANLRVIGRTSSFQFRGERKAEAAQRLNCSYVLDGSVRRATGHVRISAHLMEAASGTTLWSDRYDRTLEGVFEVQDEIAESIARALDHAFFSFSTRSVDPAVYDLYLRSSPKSYAPDELRTGVGLLEVVTQRAPHFVEAWGRLAYLRSFLHMYLPFVERASCAAHVVREASHALALDAQNNDALAARCFVVQPFGQFAEGELYLERLRRAPGSGDGRRYISWLLRLTGRLHESLDEAERIYRLDSLDPMSANLVALARMAAGRVAEAVPVYEDLVARVPAMSFPISSLLRAHAFLQNWDAVDRLLALAATRPLREFQDTIPFVRAKRDPTPETIGAWRSEFQSHVASTGGVDVARLVYAAHLGLVDEAYRAAEGARLGPAGNGHDIMGPDGYRTALLFQANMPELRNDKRFPRLCARLGLVEFWLAGGPWPDCADEVPYDFRRECERVQGASKDAFGL